MATTSSGGTAAAALVTSVANVVRVGCAAAVAVTRVDRRHRGIRTPIDAAREAQGCVHSHVTAEVFAQTSAAASQTAKIHA